MKLIVLFTLLLLTACANKNQPLDDITKFKEKVILCAQFGICKDGVTQESLNRNTNEIRSEFKRLELLAFKEGFTEDQIIAAELLGYRNASSIAKSTKAE